VASGRVDRQAAAARAMFEQMEHEHPWAGAWTGGVRATPQADRNGAWNRFVHEFSAVEARYVVSLDAGILLHHRDAIASLTAALDRRRHVNGASGRRCEDVLFKERKTFWERLALTSPAEAPTGRLGLNGELVCLRSEFARRLHLPAGLGAGFESFLTEVVGTNYFSSRFDPTRIALPPDAAHICAARIGPRQTLDCRKRRMIGQTVAHVLSHYLRSRSAGERARLAEMLREHEAADPEWLEKLVAAHARRRRFFAQLFPGVLRVPLNFVPGWRKVRQLPETCAGFVLTVIAGLRAHRSLRARPAAMPRPDSPVAVSGLGLDGPQRPPI
jgi:hypothetical protein